MLRVTRIQYSRDSVSEARIRQQVQAAQNYYVEAIEAIYANHK
jgi:hypothetical protein